MAGYMITQVHEITDSEAFKEFRARVVPFFESHGCKYIVSGAVPNPFEGSGPEPIQVSIIEFDDTDEAKAWMASAEYAEIEAIRDRACVFSRMVVEGS